MEKLTLTPQYHEIIVNNGSLDGAVDLFSYGPESEEGLRGLGSLYVIGHRETESSNMGYIVSLIAAMARREYYAQSGVTPRDAFGRMLRKVNEIVDEFFKSADASVSVGVFAIAGSAILVSKLDKFKIILARDGQTIDILNNVALFTKEHVDKRQFSNIISGTVQPNDRILAYYPSKAVTTRERYLKSYLTKLPHDEFAAKVGEIGRQHSTFSTALLCVNMIQSAESVVAAPVAYAWAPRQSTPPPIATATATTQAPTEPEEEVPQIISTEFSLGTRRNSLSKWIERLNFVRLDTRGKAIALAAVAVIIIGGVLVAKSFLFVDPQAQHVQQTIQSVRADVDQAQAQASSNPAQARQTLTRALTTLSSNDMAEDKTARNLSASILKTIDTLDNAQTGSLSLLAQIDPKIDQIVLATWSSISGSLWAVVQSSDDTLAVTQLQNGATSAHISLGQIQPSLLLPFKSGVLVLDVTAKTITRVTGGTAKSFSIPTQDTILSAVQFADAVYMLTDHAVLKITDLDTNAPVTKQWLTDSIDLASGAAQLYVDGSIWTLGHDGMLTSYYKGKKINQVQTTLEPSGRWQLLAGLQDGELAVATTDTGRIYMIDTKTGSLDHTVKIDTQQTLTQMLSGPDNSILFVSKDNKIWKVQ